MSAKSVETDRTSTSWVTVDKAAAHLGMNVRALRKAFERRATRAADGGTEASVDGVQARKFGRIWRVRFSASWGVPGTERAC